MASVSQSVARSFAVFQLFAERQNGLTATDIGQNLGAPRSRVAAILKELTSLSLISLNRRTLTYLPTLKFAKLDSWLTDADHFPAALASEMGALQSECGETVTVSWPVGHKMEVIRVARSRRTISFVAERGQRLPLWTSSVGLAFLVSMANAQVRARWEKHYRVHADIPDWDFMLDRLAEARAFGIAVVHGGVFDDASALSTIMPFELGTPANSFDSWPKKPNSGASGGPS